MNWNPGAPLSALKARAECYRTVRAFFEQRNVLEVETPLIGRATATDPHLASIRLDRQSGSARYLQTSPEFPMKRLLAAGSGDLYQICKTFRSQELGARHNPEFTMLEWYRIGFSLQDLMSEVHALVCEVLNRALPLEILDYREIFLDRLSVDPFSASDEDLMALCRQHAGYESELSLSRDGCLDLLLSTQVEDGLGRGKASFLCGYPASQAALAKVAVDAQGNRVAQRFELYLEGLEIANGYDELQDATEQGRRFHQDNVQRREQGLEVIPVDDHLLAALEHGMPDCAGVALGIDRLLMILTGAGSIDEVLSFGWERC